MAFAFTVEAATDAAPAEAYQLDAAGRPVVRMAEGSLDYEVVIAACHIWMARQGLPDEPVWFLALPPGKAPEEFLSIEAGHDTP